MRRVITIVGCGLTLAACSSSWMPSLDFLTPAPPTVTARFESEPPGAEARTSVGQACRTPCALALPAQAFTVTYTLTGYLPQTVPVQLHIPDYRSASEYSTSTDFRPNPVFAALDLAPPPPPPPRKTRPRRKKKRPVAARAPIRAPAPKPAPAMNAPPPATTFTPAPAQAPASPWPAPR